MDSIWSTDEEAVESTRSLPGVFQESSRSSQSHYIFNNIIEMVTLSHTSLWTPSGVQVNSRDSSWSLPGVFMESMWTSHWALTPTPYILLIYSSWTPDRLHQDAYFSRTPDSLLSIPKQESRRTPQILHKYSANLNLIYNVIKKQISLQRFEPYLLSKLHLTTQPQVL